MAELTVFDEVSCDSMVFPTIERREGVGIESSGTRMDPRKDAPMNDHAGGED